jgi:uncharacterized membrane protein YhhN
MLLVGIFKPLTTVLILIVALLPGALPGDPYARAVALGLLCSLIGDIVLMLPGNPFLFGLLAFLAAHICYAVAFHSGAASPAFPWILLALFAVAAILLRYLWRALTPVVRGAASLYMAAIVLMASLAMARFVSTPLPHSLSAAAGAALFMASDAMLVINRFRTPFRLVHLAVLGTYYAAQLLIALSV